MNDIKIRLLSTCCGQFSLNGVKEDNEGHYYGECGMCEKQTDFLECSSPLHPYK